MGLAKTHKTSLLIVAIALQLGGAHLNAQPPSSPGTPEDSLATSVSSKDNELLEQGLIEMAGAVEGIQQAFATLLAMEKRGPWIDTDLEQRLSEKVGALTVRNFSQFLRAFRARGAGNALVLEGRNIQVRHPVTPEVLDLKVHLENLARVLPEVKPSERGARQVVTELSQSLDSILQEFSRYEAGYADVVKAFSRNATLAAKAGYQDFHFVSVIRLKPSWILQGLEKIAYERSNEAFLSQSGRKALRQLSRGSSRDQLIKVISENHQYLERLGKRHRGEASVVRTFRIDIHAKILESLELFRSGMVPRWAMNAEVARPLVLDEQKEIYEKYVADVRRWLTSTPQGRAYSEMNKAYGNLSPLDLERRRGLYEEYRNHIKKVDEAYADRLRLADGHRLFSMSDLLNFSVDKVVQISSYSDNPLRKALSALEKVIQAEPDYWAKMEKNPASMALTLSGELKSKAAKEFNEKIRGVLYVLLSAEEKNVLEEKVIRAAAEEKNRLRLSGGVSGHGQDSALSGTQRSGREIRICRDLF